MSTATPEERTFGPWRFNVGTGDLYDGTTTIRLEPQVARLLDYLLVHQNTLISRDELMAAVWDDRIVTDDAVNRCISILRQRLTPGDRNAYIETVVRRGFISHFPPPNAAPGPAPGETPIPMQDTPLVEGPVAELPPRNAPRRWLAGLLAGAAVLTLIGWLLTRGQTGAPVADPPIKERPVVAVLPFESAGLSGDSEFFAQGIHDDLLTQLAQLESIQVISRTSVLEYRSGERRIPEIGRELGADAIIEGGVQASGDQIRMNVQLIDAHSDVHLWAGKYDRKLTPTNLFDIQAEIAQAVTSALNAALTGQDVEQLKVLPTDNMAAYRSFHEAMELRQTLTINDPAYVAALERAVSLDPGFVRAWTELAGALSFRNITERDADSILRLEKILETIREQAPTSPDYLIAQAYYTYYILKDYERADRLAHAARTMRPSDIHLLELQSWIKRRLGDYPGMIESIRRASNLDPRSHYRSLRLVSGLAFVHRYEEAIAALETTRVDNIELAALHSLLSVRDHRQPARLLQELLALEQEYGEAASPAWLWEAYIAARDYAGAADFLHDYEKAGGGPESAGLFSLPDIQLAKALTVWLERGAQPNSPELIAVRARLVRERADGYPSQYAEANANLTRALVAAMGGQKEETEQFVRAWQRVAGMDLAEQASGRHYACRALGLAEAVPATLECLRSALDQPSRVTPFFEPFLPYYDSMREDPRFKQFLTESATT